MIKPGEVKTIAIDGAGVIGGGLAAYFALKGLDVRVLEISDAAIDRAKGIIGGAFSVYKQYDICGDTDALWKRLTFTTDPAEALTKVQFVQESGSENPELKRKMIETMERCLPEDAIISSSSTGMPATLIAEGALHPERILVSHPFNPPYLIPLMEICKGEKTEQKYIDWTVEFFKLHDKIPVVVQKEKPGFIANRLAHALWREEMALVTEGVCSIEDADNAIAYGPGLRWGIMGPALGYELGAGDMGLGEMLKRYSTSSNAIFADLSNLSATPEEFPGLAAAQMPAYKANLPEYVGHTIPEIAAFRDKMLIELLKQHNKL